MKYLLLSLLTLFLAIAIGSVVVKDAGYVLLTISGWKIETSAVLFFIALFLIKVFSKNNAPCSSFMWKCI